MTLLIKNVRIVGGIKSFPETTDVFITEDKISAIGKLPAKGADRVIDGQGAYLSPGFIDVNTDSDHYLSLFDYPKQEDFLLQGVTTIVGGMCGSSLAPLLYGSLESVRKWGDVSRVNVDWRTMGEFLSLFEKKPLAVNFGTLVGHSTIRRAIIGEAVRDLSKNELAVFGETLKRSLAEGAFGLSTGLGYVHAANTPYSELKFLADIVKEHDGVYATHLRKSDADIVGSVEETIKLAKETSTKTIISHFVPVSGFEKEYEEALSRIESLSEETDFHFDVYPSDTMVFPIYVFLPYWAKSGGLEVMYDNLKDSWMQPRILKDLQNINPSDMILAQAPGNEILIGRSLQDLVETYNVRDYKAALLKLMLTTKLRAIVFYKNANYDLIKKVIIHPRALIASNSASYPYSGKMLKPERTVSTFTKFIAAALTSKKITIEDAIRKITLEPAKKFDLKKIGVVREGNFADLAVFSLDKNAESYEKYVDIKIIMVNGQVVLENGTFSGKFPGKALRHKSE